MSWLPFSLERPWVLLALAVAIFVTVGIARRSYAGQPPEVARVTLGLRLLLLVLLFLGLGGLSIVFRGKGVTVLVLRDLSQSVPTAEADRIVARLSQQRSSDESNRIGLISFGRNAGEEQPPARVLRPAGATKIDREGTDLAEAFRLADSVFTDSLATGGRRVILISDGNSTEGNALLEARNLAKSGAVIDVIPIEYFHEQESMIDVMRVPSEVHPEEPYVVEAVIDSDLPDEAMVQLYENDELIEERTVALSAGKNRIEFPRIQTDRGRYTYRMQLFPGSGRDTLPGNNVGYGFTQVRGEPRILFVTGDAEGQAPLLAAFASSRLLCDVIAPESIPLDPQDFLAYSAIVLADVNAYQLGPDAMERIHGVVKNLGVGLLMIGSPDSFGAGGYRGTPIERALPVEMDVRQRKTIPNGALAIILHTCEFPAGNMWAKQIATAAVDALTPQDLVGVLLYDGFGGHRWGVPIQQVKNRSSIANTIRSLQPADMPSFAPTMALGLAGLQNANAVSKHMVILSDGDPSPPSLTTLQGFIDAGITVSTICIQPHGGSDTGIMKKLALDTGGRYYRADDPRALPQIFFREAIQVRRNLINEVPFTPKVGVITDAIRGVEADGFPQLHGYVMTSPKALAEVALVSHEDDPILAQWRYGLGRTAAFTSDATARWGQEWIRWPGYETFWAQLLRSISRIGGGDFLEVAHSVEGDQGTLTLDAIDGDGHFIDGLDLSGQILDPSLGDQAVRFQQVGPGRYQGTFSAGNSGSYLLAVSYEGPEGLSGTTTSGFDIAYPREYRYLRSDYDALTAITEATGGKIIQPGDDLFRRDLPIRRDKQPVWEELLRIALLLFFVDVFLRRVAVNWSSLWQPLRRRAEEPMLAGAGGPVVAARGRSTPRNLEVGTIPATEVPDAAQTAGMSAAKPNKKQKRAEKKRAEEIPLMTSQLLRAKKEARKRSDDRSKS